MLRKSQFFYFIFSLATTLVAGFFIWNIFIDPGSGILNILSNIGSKNFLASVSSINENEITLLDEESGGNSLIEQNLNTSESLDIGEPPTITDQERQDILDNIQEKLDVIQQKVQEFIAEQNKDSQLALTDEEEKLDDEDSQDQEDIQDQNKDQNDNQDKTDIVVAVNKGGGTQINYPKILISELQISPIGQRFVELYNPNNFLVDLTGWYLQRKTQSAESWSSFVSSTNFENKIIGANSYFLISREISGSEILSDITLSEDNSLALKNPGGDISDKLGFGDAIDPELLATINPAEGQSVGRKVLSDGAEEETDNNLNDFELQTPTPKLQNIKYVAPVIPPTPVIKNILISEIELSDEFIELYNPNTSDIDLTDWYLQRKTAGGAEYSSFVTKNDFSGKQINANGYFLIARQGSSYAGMADILIDYPLTKDNSLVLKNSNGEVSDKLGFGLAQDFETSSAQNPDDNKSLGRIFDETNQAYSDTDNNLNDFELDSPTPKAQNIKWVEPPPVPTDTTPPEVNFSLDSIQNNLSFTINFTITDLLGTVTPSGLKSYIFHWKEEGGDWQEDSIINATESPTPTDFIRDFTGEDGKTYYFQVQATDVAGNMSDWLPVDSVFTKIDLPEPIELKPIVINEIQINPIEQRFIELYNSNDKDVDLTGYYIQRKTATSDSWGSFVSSTKLEGKIIPANGYFLISRQLADSDILLDITLSDDNSLALKNSEREIVDKVGFGLANDFEIAQATGPNVGKSISRTDGMDTNDNSKDFVILNMPTPKAE